MLRVEIFWSGPTVGYWWKIFPGGPSGDAGDPIAQACEGGPTRSVRKCLEELRKIRTHGFGDATVATRFNGVRRLKAADQGWWTEEDGREPDWDKLV